jgi:hypothetical protein
MIVVVVFASCIGRWRAWVAFLCLACSLLGCGSTGPEMARVNGKVTRHGKPLTQGTITFVSTDDGRANASSAIGAEGAYDLKTNAPGDGVQPGEYRVVVSDVNASEVLGSRPQAHAKSATALPSKYANPDTSNLSAVVKSGQNTIPFDLK